MRARNPLKNKRIFVGFNSAGASGIWSYTRVLKRRGYQIDFYGFGRTTFDVPVDKLLTFSNNRFKAIFERLRYFFKILPRYDIWHLNYMESFFFYPLNLLILKIFNKKIICTFRGSEVRSNFDFLPKNLLLKSRNTWPIYYQNLYFNENWFKKLQRKIRVNTFLLFADKVILTGPFLVSSVRYYDEIIPYARHLESRFKKNSSKKTKNKIIILHAPTTMHIKGTQYILDSWRKIDQKYPNAELRIVTGLDHKQLLEEISKADIVIDQLLAGWYGGMAVEAMMMGKTVMAYLNPAYFNFMPFRTEIPIWNTNLWTLTQDLSNLLDTYLFQKEPLAQKGIKFAHKYHSAIKIAESYERVYRSVI